MLVGSFGDSTWRKHGGPRQADPPGTGPRPGLLVVGYSLSKGRILQLMVSRYLAFAVSKGGEFQEPGAKERGD